MITEAHLEELDQLVAKALENVDLLSEFQFDFCNDWATKLADQKTDCRVSDKQQWVFDVIKTKLEKAGEL